MRAWILIVAVLSACADQHSAEMYAAQSACAAKEIASYRADVKGINERYAIARKSNYSTVDIVIERQRKIEQHCLALAHCYGISEPGLSNFFEWCLKDEQE